MFYPARGNNEGRKLLDFEYVYNELAKPGVTLSLLWAEYCAKCESEHTIPMTMATRLQITAGTDIAIKQSKQPMEISQ